MFDNSNQKTFKFPIENLLVLLQCCAIMLYHESLKLRDTDELELATYSTRTWSQHEHVWIVVEPTTCSEMCMTGCRFDYPCFTRTTLYVRVQ